MKRTALFLLITLGFVAVIISGAKTKTGTTPLPPHSPAEKVAPTKPIRRALPQQSPSPELEDPHPTISAEPGCVRRWRDDSIYGIYPLPVEEQSPAIVNDEKASGDLPDCVPPEEEVEVEPNVPSAGTPVFINFDDIPGNVEMGHRYPNVVFSSPGRLVFTFNHPTGDFPRSLPNTITRGTQFQVDHFADLVADFTKPVDDLIFYVTSCDDIFQIASLEFQYLDNNGVLRTGNDGIGGGLGHPPIKVDFKTPGIKRVTRIRVHNITDTLGLTFDDFSFVIPETTPTAPGNLSSSVSNSQVLLNWNASSGATSYKVKRSETSGGGYQQIATTASPGYLDTQVIKGHTYFYVVSAANGAGESGNSNQTTAFIPNPVPDPPQNLMAVADEEQINLQWLPSTGATSYVINRVDIPPGSPGNPNSPSPTAFTPIRTVTCSTNPCAVEDPDLDSAFIYTYVVDAVNSVGTSQHSNSATTQPLQKGGCEGSAISRPVARAVSRHGWTMQVSVTDDVGLRLTSVSLNGRFMANDMSVPYFRLDTETLGRSGVPPQRGHLALNNNASSLRSQLVHYELVENDPNKVAIIAKFKIDRIPNTPRACVNITQQYEFYREGFKGRCEPSGTIACARFRPMVSYDFHGAQAEILKSLNTPMRLHYQVKGSTTNSIGVFRDSDSLGFDDKKNPVTSEFWAYAIGHEPSGAHFGPSQALGKFDNIHQTNADYVQEPGIGPGLNPEAHLLAGGCPECVHNHWRWGAFFGPKWGSGIPLRLSTSTHTVDFGVVKAPGQVGPNQDWITLVNGDYIRTVETKPNPNPAFPPVVTGNHGNDVVFWYSPTGYMPADSFFTHAAWFNPHPPGNGPIALEAAAGFLPTQDGPLSIEFGDVYENGTTTFGSYDLTTLPPLPPGYAALNNQGYKITTTAVVSGPHDITFGASSITDSNTFNNLRIFHPEPDPFDPEQFVWVDKTILPPDSPAPDFSTRTIHARTEGLGAFVIAKLVQVIPPSTDVADISVTTSDSNDPIVAGNQLTYTIQLTNNGPQTGHEVALRDGLPPETDFVSATSPQGNCKDIDGTVYCAFNSLNPGATATVTLVVRPQEGVDSFPPEGKDIFNSALVKAKEGDSNINNNLDVEGTHVLPNPNRAPEVKLTSPITGAFFAISSTLTLTASAFDNDGSITKVEFFDNGEPLGLGTAIGNGAYQLSVSAVHTGPHVLVAVATDNGGRQNISNAVDLIVNGPAVVNLTSPANGALFAPGSNITLAANANLAGGSITKVEFLLDGEFLGLGNPAGGNAYNFTWTNVPEGNYSLTAVATDGFDMTSTSVPVLISVDNPPTVSITSPADSSVFQSQANISISATAEDASGVAKVDFYANSLLIGTCPGNATSTFTVTWRQPQTGIYSLTAIASDTLGRTTTSAPITVGINTPTPEPGNFIWFDDAPPAGAALFGNRDGWYWVDSNPAPFSGPKHHQSQIARGFHEHGFENSGFKLPVNTGDKLYTYVFLSPGFKPQELMLAWRDQTGSWEHRAYWSDRTDGNWISNYGVDGTVSRRRMGPLPVEGSWVRLEIPAADVGLAGQTVIGMSFITYGGRAAFDRTGKTNRPTPTPQPPADVPYFDDALPQGAVEDNFNDTWRFITSNPAPISGLKAHQSFIGTSGDDNKYRAHAFKGASQFMTVDPGDTLYTWVYMDPNVKPDELVVGWHDGTDWHRAYWGASWVLAGGRWGTESMRFMGGLPAAGTWVRLEVPAGYVGLEGKRVSGMYFGMNREAKHGLVTWDVSGKSTIPVSTSFESLFATVPIHQFFDNNEGYSYFLSEKRRSSAPVLNKWFVHSNQAPGTVPVTRMKNSTSGHYLLTRNPDVAGPGWVIDMAEGDGGKPFFIYPNAGTPDTTPLHYYRGPKDYYYTTDPNDLAINGAVYQGVLGWVHPARSVMSPQANLIDDAKFFVQQHYSDFLSREPDNAGLTFWTGQYNICAPWDLPCIDDKRNNISAAFFLSIEFQETGYFVYRYRKASFNVRPNRQQLYDDKAIVGLGVVVGNPGWEALLAGNKNAFAEAWVQRPEFKAVFDPLSNEQYVDRLIANAGIDPAAANRNGLVSGLNSGTQTRATVLRAIVDTQAFITKEFNPAFVLMEYFGYLQRNPDDPPDNDFRGFDFWLNKLNQHNGNYLSAEMVKSFLVSAEYRGRFGPPAGPNSAALLTVGSNVSAKVGNLAGKFATVSSAGLMEVKGLYPWSIDEPPVGYTFFKNLAWKVASTSNTSPPYTITANIPWEVADATEFAKLRIFNREGNAWVDRTILAPDSPAPDFSGRTLSARVNTLSTVIVAHEGDTQTSLSLTSPSEGAIFNAPASISINTSSYDPDGVIDKVQFYNGNELIGEDTTVPYSMSWTGVTQGTYAITARAFDNMGVNIASATRNVVVNGPPMVVIVSPLAGTSFETPANIVFEAYASSSTGITKVEFFQGATKLGEDTTAPYTFNWNGVGLGSYNLTAKATNNANLSTTSSTATISVVNTPPTVSITSPANGANLGNSPANVVITAAAADSHGIKNVEFFKNGISLGIDTTAPYSFSWNNVPTGTFNLTAKATDNLDAVTISAPVSVTVTNTPPSVSITAPAPNTAYTAPASITINATATDNEGVSKVEFFQNSTKLGEDTTAPYSFTWTNAGSGTYSLTARATDGQNATTTSSAVNVTVNAQPSITLTSPANGATYIAPAGVVLEASASDADGTITQVEFFQNNASIGLDTSAPYSLSWAHVPFGSYSLTARATDDRGATVTSNVVNITVNPASTVLITSPNNNAVFIGGATVTISANATDSDGISKVEFFQGTTKLGEDTTAPYSYDWTDVAAGDYSLTARATDTLGEVTNSAAMSISVLPQVKQFVGWSSVSNGLDLGNGTVRKTSTGTWDFSANSLQKLLAGDGYFESTAANYDQSIGVWGSDGTSRALVIGNGGWAAIYENGQEVANTSPLGNITPHSPGDRYRVEITNGVLRFVRYRSSAREVMFSSAAVLPAYPISLGLGMSPQNAEWQKTVLAQLTRKVTWSAIVNGVDLGNGSVRKTSTGTWDFSATAKQTLLRGDGYFESTASYWNHSINVSGSNGAGGSLVVGTGGWAALYENGQEVANTSPLGNLTPHASGDRYRVEVTNGVLRYVRYRSGARAVLYTSTNPLPAYPLSFSLASSFQNSEWQNTVIAQLSQTASWSYINNGIDLGNGSVRKTSTGTWDFSAGPRQQLVFGSGYFESTASYWNHSINISGSNGAGGSLVVGTGGWAALYENGQEVANTSPLGNLAPHASGDRYRMEISNGKLRYVRYRSGVRSIVFTSANALPAYAMSYSLGSSFQNSEWQNTVFSDNVPEHNDASFVSQSVPTTMVPGQTYTVSVTMRNTGASTWTPDGDYQLASENPLDTQRWGVNRVNLNSTVLPGSDGTFSFTVTAPAVGTHSFQWRMVQQGVQRFGALTPNVSVQTTSGAAAPSDDSNAKAGSNDSVNDLPFAALTMPATGAAYEAPASIEIEASAYDTDGRVVKVEFFANGASLGQDTSAPFSLTWKNVPAGSYSLTVVVTDDRNATMTSAPVNINVSNKLEDGGQDATGADSETFDRRKSNKSGRGDLVVTSSLRADKPPPGQVSQRSVVLRSNNRRE